MKYKVRRFNPVKPLRRFVGPKSGGNEYEVINKEKERLSHNRKHLRQALAYMNGGSLPAGFEKEPDAVKFGYYMDRETFDLIVSSGADDLKGIEGSEGIGRKAHARKALNNFFGLLRGGAFDLTWAVHGAVMILQCDLKGQVLPKELQNLAFNLWSAGDRIGVEIDVPLFSWGAVIGTVTTERRRETGDVRVIRWTDGTFTFRTKEISTNRTRFGVFPKRTAGVHAIRAKLSAAYQSIYHVAKSEKPNFLNMTPLYGSDEDGSDIVRVAVPCALKEAVRATTLDPKLRIKFTGGADSHYAFRKELAKELARIFPHRGLRSKVKDSATTARKKISASHIDFDKGGSDSTNSRSDSGLDDGAESSAGEKAARGKSSLDLSDVNEARRSIGSSTSHDRVDSRGDSSQEAESQSFDLDNSICGIEDENSASYVSVAEGEFGFRGGRRVGFVENGWSTNIGNPEYKQEWGGIGLPKLKSELSTESDYQKSEADGVKSSSISENDGVMRSMDIIEDAVVSRGESIPKYGHSGEAEEAVVAEEGSRLGQLKKEDLQPKKHKPKKLLVRARKRVRKIINVRPSANVKSAVDFEINVEKSLLGNDIVRQIDAAVNPLLCYIYYSGPAHIDTPRLEDDAKKLASDIDDVLSRISDSDFVASDDDNEAEIERAKKAMQACRKRLNSLLKALVKNPNGNEEYDWRGELGVVVKAMINISKPLSLGRVTPSNLSDMVSGICQNWRRSPQLSKEEILTGIGYVVDGLNKVWDLSRSDRGGWVGLGELEKNHKRLNRLYSKIENTDAVKNERKVSSLLLKAYEVLQTMQSSSATNQ